MSLRHFLLNWDIEIGPLQISFCWLRSDKLFIHLRQRHLIYDGRSWGYRQRVWAFFREPGFEERWNGEWSFQEVGSVYKPKPKVFELGFPCLRYISIHYKSKRIL